MYMQLLLCFVKTFDYMFPRESVHIPNNAIEMHVICNTSIQSIVQLM